MDNKKKKITIIGSGLAGSYFAILLAKKGYTVDIYEKFTEKEIADRYTTNRSYNLTFYDYGVEALKEAGVWEKIKHSLVTLDGSVAQIGQNPPVQIPKDCNFFFTVQRAALLRILIQEGEGYPNLTFHFGKALIELDREQKHFTIQDVITKKNNQIPYDVLIGADGIHSPVRMYMQAGQLATTKKEYADWEYKQIHIDKKHAKDLHLEKAYMYAWTREKNFMLAHPNIDYSFSALLVMPKDKQAGFSSLQSPEAIQHFIEKHYRNFIPALDLVIKEILANPVSHFITIYTSPWYYKDTIALIGDAAHGFNPFYGQGVSAGFADALTLVALIDTYGSDWGTIFAHYQEQHKRHTDALAILSRDSITQHLRKKRADYTSVYNKIDTVLYRIFPNFFAPPPYIHIPANPLLADDYVQKHQQQRRRNRWIGIPLAVGLATGLIAIYEVFSRWRNKE